MTLDRHFEMCILHENGFRPPFRISNGENWKMSDLSKPHSADLRNLRVCRPGETADLRNLGFRDSDFTGANLSKVRLEKTDLRGTVLKRTCLEHTFLRYPFAFTSREFDNLRTKESQEWARDRLYDLESSWKIP